MSDTALTFYGVRGSYPVSGKNFNKYGGHTSSILLENNKKIVILDAGTGIIDIGRYIKRKKLPLKEIHIFITHLHFDHIQGLPFFDPIFGKDYIINIYGPEEKEISFSQTLFSLFNHPFSPISNNGIKANVNVFELNVKIRGELDLGDGMIIEYLKENSHPQSGVLLYKLILRNASVVYATDVESPKGFLKKHINFISGADILIHDSQYFDEDYINKNHPRKGFGHSTVSMAAENASRTGVNQLYLFHYNPNYTDRDLDRMIKTGKGVFENTFPAQETKKITIRR